MADQPSIIEATLACHQIFRHSAAVPALQEWAENCLADLKLWANGAGALKVGKASLDTRLTSNPDAKIFVNDFLLGADRHGDGLDQAIQDVKSIIGQSDQIMTSSRKAGIHAQIQKADASYNPGHPQVKALKNHLQLLLLSRPRYNSTLQAETSSDSVLLVSSIDGTIVSEPRSLTVIQRRLIKTNLKRRSRFLYTQRHTIKLSDMEPAPAKSTSTSRKTPQPLILNPVARSTDESKLPTVYSTTTATEVQDPIPFPTRDSAQPATTIVSAISSRVTYPKPPQLRPDQNVFQCPCCCQTLPASMSRGSQWKKHLSKDILPYTCILDDCPRPEINYHTKDLWLSHMFTDHGGFPHWVCLACNDSSERPTFYEESAFTEHLEQMHSTGIKPHQVQMLVSAWRRKTPVTVGSCPLCELTDLDSDVLNHVAEHLHSFSLKSLPWAPGDSESEDTRRSEDTGSVGSGSIELSDPGNLDYLSIKEYDEEPTENNQLTEEKIHCLSENLSSSQDMMGVFLASIENEDAVTAPFRTPPSPAGPDSDLPVDEEEEGRFSLTHHLPSLSLTLPTDSDDDDSWAVRPPLPAPSDSEPSTDGEDEHQDSASLNPPSSSPAGSGSYSNNESAPPGFQPSSATEERLLSNDLSRYIDLNATPLARAQKAETAVKAGAVAGGFISFSGMLLSQFSLPQDITSAGELPRTPIVLYKGDYFHDSLDTLFRLCFDWVSDFLEPFSDVLCRSLSNLHPANIRDRFRDAILNGYGVDALLAEPLHRRNIFMSVIMTMVWKIIFTRYLFGLERPIRSGIKRLEKDLGQSLPQEAVHRWRATTLSVLARDIELKQQQERDIQAISITIIDTLMSILSERSLYKPRLREELDAILRHAVQLSVEMRMQLAEYIMLPPFQPEYDSQGNLTSQIFFNASLMHDESGVYASDEQAQNEQAVVRSVLFPLVVRKGDDDGKGDEEVVVYRAQVVVSDTSHSDRHHPSPAHDTRDSDAVNEEADYDSDRTSAGSAPSQVSIDVRGVPL
ncbi:hypothetical protein BO83DRAFT_455369 [Aspergillus eucalypticola CBS 122712]|uniref:Uncharacterized protein n=1 Tax=Aspergillus eucalypticola (strain CBS 122712 / IBT 29274) TaxID=1448314 RepID=A0A317USS4_ASPEC|nr:uncharacterized protein BO83DRAFT_455369 [Aspergillus eucalypticola CBS 122712]PWY64409.1 hypothetical protein BO83DRAFT_455369 [Aspergillus eucalypticola CBS 122712]